MQGIRSLDLTFGTESRGSVESIGRNRENRYVFEEAIVLFEHLLVRTPHGPDPALQPDQIRSAERGLRKTLDRIEHRLVPWFGAFDQIDDRAGIQVDPHSFGSQALLS